MAHQHNNIITEDLVCWYELSASSNHCLTITVEPSVYEEALPQLSTYSSTNLTIKRIGDLGSFALPGDSRWGYLGSLESPIVEEGGWIRINCPLPVVFKDNVQEGWIKGTAISASLAALFSALAFRRDQLAQVADKKQLVDHIALSQGADMGHFAPGCFISKHFADWFAAQPNGPSR